jgi:Putative beta-barrel porin-2, OmpL-like. bbp2
MKTFKVFREVGKKGAAFSFTRWQSGNSCIHGKGASIVIGILLLGSPLEASAQRSQTASGGRPVNENSPEVPHIKPPAADTDKRAPIDLTALLEELQRMHQAIERLEQSNERLESRIIQLEAQRHAPRLIEAVSTDRTQGAEVPNGFNRATNAGAREPIKLEAREVGATASNVENQPGIITSQERPSASDDRGVLDFLRDTTINLSLDTYYGYNFNRPFGRVNLLRAYDVLSNAISLNQASVIFERAPDVARGRRFGARVDLQFGQATETLQGNPFNEPRPQIYRNIFQAYGTVVAPVAKGLTVDFGKWASSLGIENNYNKDQMNYSRSYFFNFLPFYHMGVRANLKLNDTLSVNYWITNGTQQTEPFNGFKDELVGLVIQPHKTVSWTVNYYLGQEHPDVVAVPNTGSVPLQPGLSFDPIRPAPNGKLHILDSYVTWQATPKFTMALEGDYVIQRLWKDDAPGRSSAPSHVIGGAVYARYQFTPKLALAGRAEYLSDRGGMFSGVTQALKENTLTIEYKLPNGFLTRLEWRRDFSNQSYFFTDRKDVLKKEQNTATIGLIWWWGRKEGAW